MERYIKDGQIKSRNEIVIRKDKMQTFNPTEEMIFADGWKVYIPAVTPEPTEEELALREKANEVRLQKTLLSESDYKVIKCMEAYLCGEELPYDIMSLHEERDAQRARINELEGDIV